MKTTNLKNSLMAGLAILASGLNLQATNLTWDATATTASPGAQDGAGNWTALAANTNWWDGAANVTWNNATPDNATFGANSGAAGTVTVPTLTTNTVGNLTFNAPGSSGYNLAAGSSTTSKINLSGTPTITVASGVFATNLVVLAGTSFTKLGAGTFVLKPGAANVNSGPTVVGGGTLIIGASNGRQLIPGDLTITNGATAQLGANQQIASSATITVDGGTFDTGANSQFISGFILDNSGQVIGSSSSIALTNNGATYDLRSGTIAPNLAGTAGLTKMTGGTVLLSNGGGANTFAGPVLVSAGILDLNHSGTGAGLPGVITTITNTGMVRLQHDTEFNTNATVIIGGGTFELLAHNDTVSTLILDNNGLILNGGNTSKTLTVLTNMDFRNGLCASKLGGASLMVKSTAGTVTLTMDNANTGGTLISAGILQLGDGTVNRGQFGTGPVTNNSVIVLNHTNAFTLANVISGSGSLTNLGGSPSLTGGNTYIGGTTVRGGTLFANNTSGSATGSGVLIIQSGAGLGGTGIVSGVVTIQSGGKLSPGNSSLGTLTISGSLTLNANTTNTFDVNGTNGACDVVVAGSTVTYGGVLTISTNSGPTFTAGQQFVLFSGAGATNAGNFASIVGSPGVNLAFNFTNGVLSVVSAGSPTPPLLSVSPPSGGTLTFSWTDPSFKLQSQTNNLSTGLNGIWGDYPSGGTSPVGVTINPANPTVFFRLSQYHNLIPCTVYYSPSQLRLP